MEKFVFAERICVAKYIRFMIFGPHGELQEKIARLSIAWGQGVPSPCIDRLCDIRVP